MLSAAQGGGRRVAEKRLGAEAVAGAVVAQTPRGDDHEAVGLEGVPGRERLPAGGGGELGELAGRELGEEVDALEEEHGLDGSRHVFFLLPEAGDETERVDLLGAGEGGGADAVAQLGALAGPEGVDGEDAGEAVAALELGAERFGGGRRVAARLRRPPGRQDARGERARQERVERLEGAGAGARVAGEAGAARPMRRSPSASSTTSARVRRISASRSSSRRAEEAAGRGVRSPSQPGGAAPGRGGSASSASMRSSHSARPVSTSRRTSSAASRAARPPNRAATRRTGSAAVPRRPSAAAAGVADLVVDVAEAAGEERRQRARRRGRRAPLGGGAERGRRPRLVEDLARPRRRPCPPRSPVGLAAAATSASAPKATTCSASSPTPREAVERVGGLGAERQAAGRDGERFRAELLDGDGTPREVEPSAAEQGERGGVPRGGGERQRLDHEIVDRVAGAAPDRAGGGEAHRRRLVVVDE